MRHLMRAIHYNTCVMPRVPESRPQSPKIGTCDVRVLRGPELLEVLRRIESRGTYDLAHCVRSICSWVLRYARATGRQCDDVAADLVGILTPVALRAHGRDCRACQNWHFAALNRSVPRRATVHQRIAEMADPLHFGNFGGLATKLLWLVSGLALCALAMAGAALYSGRAGPL